MLFDTQSELDMFINNFSKKSIDNNQSKLTNKEIGLQRGNMFNQEYLPYKNYVPDKIEALNEKDDLLLKLFETDFAITDIALYLDLHSDDNKMYEIYKNYVESYEKYKKIYEEKYGPLLQNCTDYSNYQWIKNPWPWDKMGGIKYV